MEIKVGQKATTYDGRSGIVTSVQNGIVGVKLNDGKVIYRYLNQIVKLF